MKIKGAIFDMDGTLVDSLGFWAQYWNKLGKKYFNQEGFVAPQEVDVKVRTMVLWQDVLYIKEYFNITDSAQALYDFTREEVDRFYKEDVVAKEGVFEFLDYLKECGIAMAVASASTKQDVINCLENCKLAPYFSCVLSSNDLGVGKDKPDVYIATMQQMGLKAEEVCVFEDSFVAIETAKKLGCKTVGIFDKNNFGHDRLRASSDMYLDDGMQMKSLIGKVDKG